MKINPSQIPELTDLERDPAVTVLHLIPLQIHHAVRKCELHRQRQTGFTGILLGVYITAMFAFLGEYRGIGHIVLIALYFPLVYAYHRAGVAHRATIIARAKAALPALPCSCGEPHP